MSRTVEGRVSVKSGRIAIIKNLKHCMKPKSMSSRKDEQETTSRRCCDNGDNGRRPSANASAALGGCGNSARSSADTGSKNRKAKISEITGAQVQSLLAKLDLIWDALGGDGADPPLLPLRFHEVLSRCDYDLSGEANSNNGKNGSGENDGSGAGKHVLQEASILGHLRRIGALPAPDGDEGGDGNNEETSTTKSWRKRRRRRRRRCCAVELGAGTARLSDRLSRSTGGTMDHVLIDRKEFAPSQTRDRHMAARARELAEDDDDEDDEVWEDRRAPRILRVTSDIAALNLADFVASDDGDDDVDDQGRQVQRTSSSSAPTTRFMSKHLCGPACDAVIAGLGSGCSVIPHQHQQQQRRSATRPPPPIALATCCHYLCTFESFSGKRFWTALGLTREDFKVAAAASQWASLGKKKRNKRKRGAVVNGGSNTTSDPDPAGPQQQLPPNLMEVAERARRSAARAEESGTAPKRAVVPSDEFERTFSREEKAELGRKLKQLLDLSRAARFQELGYGSVDLVRYTSQSLEDRLLLAW